MNLQTLQRKMRMRSIDKDWSEDDDYFNSRMEKVKQIINSICNKKTEFLDIGCTRGFLSTLIVPNHYHGVDISKELVSKSLIRNKIKIKDINSGLPYGDKKFDFIFAGELIEHLIDTDFFLRECYRVIKNKGYLLLTTPNLASFWNRLKILLGRQPLYVDYRNDFGHLKSYTLLALISQLRENKFKIINVRGNLIAGRFMPLYIKEILGDLFPDLSEQMIILSRK